MEISSVNTENWHKNFDPKVFLNKVNLNRLIEKNKTYNEKIVENSRKSCFICKKKQPNGVLLNDKTYICKGCFTNVSYISYPEKYEKRRRDYLILLEARNLSYQKLQEQYSYQEKPNVYIVIIIISVLLIIASKYFFILLIIALAAAFIHNIEQTQKINKWSNIKARWLKNYPPPIKPELRHFHDPLATLTKADRKILKVFNHWPGYPPFWQYLREVVLKRDNYHCQVTGCPSRFSKHIHHKIAVSQGGEHTPSNLVTLCEFHHAIEPESGHERVWGNINTSYFTIVRDHTRRNKTSKGAHSVAKHIRRLKLTTDDELKKIISYHQLSCPECNGHKISLTLTTNIVTIRCMKCESVWGAKKLLTEETGPALAEILTSNLNKGSWFSRWEMLDTRYKGTFASIKEKSKKRNKITVNNVHKTPETPLCPKCNSPMKLIIPRKSQSWKKFWGCSQYYSTNCRGTRQYI